MPIIRPPFEISTPDEQARNINRWEAEARMHISAAERNFDHEPDETRRNELLLQYCEGIAYLATGNVRIDTLVRKIERANRFIEQTTNPDTQTEARLSLSTAIGHLETRKLERGATDASIRNFRGQFSAVLDPLDEAIAKR